MQMDVCCPLGSLVQLMERAFARIYMLAVYCACQASTRPGDDLGGIGTSSPLSGFRLVGSMPGIDEQENVDPARPLYVEEQQR